MENPLEDLQALQSIHRLILNGQIIEKAQLDQMAEKAGDRRNIIPTALRYAEYLLEKAW
jgi:F0F1-type ATP synthase beta subunit